MMVDDIKSRLKVDAEETSSADRHLVVETPDYLSREREQRRHRQVIATESML